MDSKYANLRRSQLDRSFSKNSRSLTTAKRPAKGWIKEIREALMMSMQDMGNRMGVIKQRVFKIEKDEIAGKLTLESMEKAAEALDCTFVYFLVPKNSLEDAIQKQARVAATKLVKQVQASMRLEGQAVGAQAERNMIEEIAREMIDQKDRRIWKKT